MTFKNGGPTLVPLDVTAERGHLEVARELIREHGIEGCGGASSGVLGLAAAAENQHMDVMELLTSAGVADTGVALIAATRGRESSVKFLLQRQEWKAGGRGAGYLQTRTRTAERPCC